MLRTLRNILQRNQGSGSQSRADDIRHDLHNHQLDFFKSVKHTDSHGYTSEIVPKKPGHSLSSHDYAGHERQGAMFIHHPNGERVRTGYWMGHPEKHWTHNGQSLAGNSGKKVWNKMSVGEKLAKETHAQAHDYAPLSHQFTQFKNRV